MKRLNVLYEDQDIIVCLKPMGIPSQRGKTRDIDMLTLVKKHLFDKNGDGGEPYAALIHRLDRPVGGIMVFALNQESASNLGAQIADGKFRKSYQAVLTGELKEDSGKMADYLLRDGRTNTSRIVQKGTKGAKKAELTYEVLDVAETDAGILSYVLIELLTGRHHQIRVQCAGRGAGVYGDTKYNPMFQGRKKTYQQIGLYATRLAFFHPVSGERVVFKTEPEGEAFALMDAFGG